MPFMRKYNTLLVTGTTAIRIPIVKRGVVDFAVGADWTPVAGDVKIAVDGAAPANVTNLPTAVASGNGAYWEFILTAAELSCKQAIVTVVDATTKAIEDQSFIIETYGNASAMYAADLSLANLPANVTQLLGTAWLTPAVAGTPDVNAKQINGVSAASVTTINANIGTTQPTNFTGTGGSALVKGDTIDVGGTAQTARDLGASVLISAGTGAGQLDVTNGVVKANLVQILATALTETAGQIAAGFKKFFNVATPVLDTTSVNQTGDAFARLGAPAGASVSADIASKLATSAYIAPDNTNIANAAASAASADGKATSIKAKTDNLPASPAAVGSAMTLDFSQQTLLSPTAGTVGQAVAGMLADSVGKRVYSPPASNPGTGSITLYARDGTTALITLTVTTDASGNITSLA